MNASFISVDFSHAQRNASLPDVEYPLPPHLGTCVVIHGFLSPDECVSYITAGEQRGFRSAESDYPPSYRNNDRHVVDDDGFAKALLDRLREKTTQLGLQDLIGRDQAPWRLVGLNERIRICRYRPGQQFRIHQDGVHHRGVNCQSRLTFMIYLTEGASFEGGDTLFYAGAQPEGESGNQSAVIARLRPRAGSLILFDHAIWHAGDTVKRGVKHILRSDLIYRRAPSRAPLPETRPFTPGHDGYVWTIAKLSDARIASGGRDGTIRTWDGEGNLRSTLRGHRQSVLGLAEVRPGLIASVSRDRSLRFWDLETRTCVRSVIAHDSAVLSLSHDGENGLVTGGADHRLALWTSEGDAKGALHGHTGWVWAATALGGGRFVSASEDGSVKLWHLGQQACIETWPGETPLRTVDAAATNESPTNCLVASGDIGGFVLLRRTNGERGETVAIAHAHAGAVRRVRFLSRELLATCGEDNLLRVWKIPDFTCIHQARHDNFVTDVQVLSDHRLLSSGYDGALIRHDISVPSATE
jgi:WD40 repeat protein